MYVPQRAEFRNEARPPGAFADIVIASDDSLFGHSAFRYVGWAARQWQWATMMGLRKFQEVIGLQGGDPRVCDDTSLLPRALRTQPALLRFCSMAAPAKRWRSRPGRNLIPTNSRRPLRMRAATVWPATCTNWARR